MSGVECSICLETLRSPVVTPCGHMHCEECLLACVETSEDPINATCPTCRASFPIVQPDVRFVPKKLQSFIMPSIRRVYIPEESSQTTRALRQEIRKLEKRVKQLSKDKESLMERCESAIRARDAIAEREIEAREQCDELQEEVTDLNGRIEELSADNQELRETVSRYKKKYNVYKLAQDAKSNMVENDRPLRRAQRNDAASSSTSRTKRTSAQAALDNSSASSLSSHFPDTPPQQRKVVKKPRLAESMRLDDGNQQRRVQSPATYLAQKMEDRLGRRSSLLASSSSSTRSRQVGMKAVAIDEDSDFSN